MSFNGHVQVGKGVPRSFFVRAERVRCVLFFWCHDPPRTPQTLSARQSPDFGSVQMSDPSVRIRTDVQTGYPALELGQRTRTVCNPSSFWGFQGVRTYGNPGNPETSPTVFFCCSSVLVLHKILLHKILCIRVQRYP